MADDLRILFEGIEGGISIDEKSGENIKNDLIGVVNNINSKNVLPKIKVEIEASKPSQVQTQLSDVINKIDVAPIKIKLDTKFDSNKINTSVQDINKKIQEMLSKSEKYSDYYVGKTSNRQVSGSDDRLISLQLYNDEMKKAITLKYKYNSEDNAVEFVSQEDISNTKQLLDLQEKLAKSTEKQMVALQDQVDASSIAGTLEGDFTKSSAAIKSLRSDTTALNNELNLAKTGFKTQQENIQNLMNGRDTSQLNANELEKLQEYILKMNEAVKLKKQLDKKVGVAKSVQSSDNGIHNDTMALKNLIAQMEDYQRINDRFKQNSNFDSRFEGVLQQAKVDDLSGNIANAKELEKQFKTLRLEIKGLGLEGQSFGAKMQAQMSKLGVYFSAATVMMAFGNQVKKMVSNVIELDKELVDLQMVTNGTRESTEKLISSYNDLAKDLKTTTKSVTTSANEWLRQGKSISDTNTLITDSMILSKVGMLSSAESTQYLTASMKGYKVATEDALGIVDKVSKVDMISATNAGGLMEGMSRVANFANDVGYSMDKLLATLATIGEVTQRDMSTVGDSMKNLFARMSNIKLGKLTDDEGESLSDVETSLNAVGIKLRENETTYRNYGNVLDEVAGKWNNFNDVEQNTIAAAFAGTRRIEDFRVLMSNYGNIQKYTDAAANSAGSAMEKFEAYKDGAEASFESLKANFEDLSLTLVNSDFIKGSVNLTTGVLGTLTKIIDTVGALPTLFTVATTAMSAFTNKGRQLQVKMFQYEINNEMNMPFYGQCGDAVQDISENGANYRGLYSNKHGYSHGFKWCA